MALPIDEANERFFDTTLATWDHVAACQQAPNIWYCYTAPETGTVTVSLCDSQYDTAMAVYEGCNCSPLGSQLACSDDACGPTHQQSELTFAAMAGQSYLIEVGGHFGRFDQGQGTMNIEVAPWGMGACCVNAEPYCYEDYSATCSGFFAGDGSTCDPSDCNDNGAMDVCDIASGASLDCNGNGVPDECDLSGGTSQDHDANQIPDECEADCNGNSVVDTCDLDCGVGNCLSHPNGCGTSTDCQQDGIPDDCQLGGLGGSEVTLYDNGEPMSGEDPAFHLLDNSIGGSTSESTILDDMELAMDSRVNGFVWYHENDEQFEWSGRVRLLIYADNGAGGPDTDGGPLVEMWIPTDGGTVTETYFGPGAYNDRYEYRISDIDIPLESGIWWIGAAPEANNIYSSGWCVSHAGSGVVNGQAHVRIPDWGIPEFIPGSEQWPWDQWDVAFYVITTVSGADCNENFVPDECDIEDCDGSPWCSDCQMNGVPDGCEDDCNENQIADECDIADCDGSGWCQDCNENEIPDVCEPDCNLNGTADECDIAWYWSFDCNENGVPDECDVNGSSQDYDQNGVPDECDPDCDANGVVDVCDLGCFYGDCSNHPLGCGSASDCQPDGIPDACETYGEMTYLMDDGTREHSIKVSDGGYMAWMNRFVVEDGHSWIDTVNIVWGKAPDGATAEVYIWEDPNRDGNPTDAKVLASATTTVVNPEIDTFNPVPFDRIYVGPTGTKFFVGAILQHGWRERPAALDTELPQRRSWMVGDANNPIDPNNLGAAAFPPYLVDDLTPGNWLIRADAVFLNDCNENDVPDDCDIAAAPAIDCDGNNVIDSCEWQDCNGNGVHDPCDIAGCPQNEVWCADCNNNHVPDVCDLPPLGPGNDCQGNSIPDECEEDCNGNTIPDECDMTNCDGSSWCDDCNQDERLDVCQLGFVETRIFEWDDGGAEGSAGVGGGLIEMAWVQNYNTEGKTEIIAAVSTAFGAPFDPEFSGVQIGDPFRVFLWSDPDGDGNPVDAELLASASATIEEGMIGTNTLQVVAIEPTEVLGSFFIGAAVESELGPAPQDLNGPPAHASYMVWNTEGALDPSDLSTQIVLNMDDAGSACNFLLRAITQEVLPLNDCNENGVPDDCDLSQGTSHDDNQNAIPDECELSGDVNGDGAVNFEDFSLFIDCMAGPGYPNPGCDPVHFAMSDVDDDDDVDLDDFGAMQTTFTGNN